MPAFASASIFGVRQNLLPFTPSESKRCWSVVIKRIFMPNSASQRFESAGAIENGGGLLFRFRIEFGKGPTQFGEAFHLISESALRVGMSQQVGSKSFSLP